MSSEQTATSESAEASPSGEQGDTTPDSTDWRAKATQYQQQLKRAQDLNREAMPHVQLGLALRAAPGGEAIIQKLEKGEALTAKQEATLKEAAAGGVESGALSKKDAEELLAKQAQEFEQRMWAAEKAKETRDELDSWASEKYPGYNDLKKTSQWRSRLNMILAGIQQGELQVPDDWSDPYQYAISEAYDWVKAKNPDIGKEKPAKKTETERRAQAAAGNVQAGGAPPTEESDELPEWARLDTPAKRLGGGKPFSSLKRE